MPSSREGVSDEVPQHMIQRTTPGGFVIYPLYRNFPDTPYLNTKPKEKVSELFDAIIFDLVDSVFGERVTPTWAFQTQVHNSHNSYVDVFAARINTRINANLFMYKEKLEFSITLHDAPDAKGMYPPGTGIAMRGILAHFDFDTVEQYMRSCALATTDEEQVAVFTEIAKHMTQAPSNLYTDTFTQGA